MQRAHRPFGLTLVAALVALAGCTTVLTRAPVPAEEAGIAAPYGIVGIGPLRAWGDRTGADQGDVILELWSEAIRRTHAEEIAAGEPIIENMLALSGGGPDGAYGAGLLQGWTERGDRPRFDVVTGISTGAIVALFAFLGPDYDDEMREVYTTYETDQLVTPALFTGLTGGSALVDNRNFRALIEEYVDEEVVAKLAEEALKGRVLLIGTTNLDATRPMVWSLGGIAATGHPDARRLIHDVIQASSAIPAAFPPVLIPVQGSDGTWYDEMHVDGGATQQVMFLSPDFPMRQVDEAVGTRIDRTLYVVVNNRLKKTYDPVRPRVISVAGAAVSGLISGSNTGDIYKIFAIAARDGIELRFIDIPESFDLEAEEPFDKVYMQGLYDTGREDGLAGERWLDSPPDYVAWP